MAFLWMANISSPVLKHSKMICKSPKGFFCLFNYFQSFKQIQPYKNSICPSAPLLIFSPIIKGGSLGYCIFLIKILELV